MTANDPKQTVTSAQQPTIEQSPKIIMRILASIAAVLLLSSSADACQLDPLHGVMHDPAGWMEKAGFIFKGRILAIEPAEMTEDEFAALSQEKGRREAERARYRMKDTVVLTFEVDSVWKGQVAERFVALYYSPIPMCEVTPFVDELYLVMGGVHEVGRNRVGPLIHESRIEEFERRLNGGN